MKPEEAKAKFAAQEAKESEHKGLSKGDILKALGRRKAK